MATAIKRGKTWTAYWELGRDAQGKRKQDTKGGFPTKKAAVLFAQEQERAVAQGIYVRPTKLTVGDYMAEWLRDYAEVRLRTRTAQGYAGVVRRYITPVLGSMALSALRPAHIEAFYADLQRRGLAPATNKQTHVILKSALNRAVRLGLLAVNPCAVVDAPRLKRTEVPILSNDEVRLLVDALDGDAFGTAVKLALYTGMRRSELLALKWADVDLAAGTLSVRRTLHVAKGGRIVIEAPKSDRSRRQVDLSPNTVAFLRAWKAAQAEQRLKAGELWGPSDWVFTNGLGRHLLPDSVSYGFWKLARKLGLNVSLHGLRHVHASVLLQQGISLKIVSERLGHSSVAITGDVYAHVAPGLGKAAAHEFDRALSV